jgi:hypothetical protein
MRFFFLPAKLTTRRMFKKVSKNLKIVCAQVTQTKTGLFAVWTFSPLGINKNFNFLQQETLVFVELLK